MKLPRKHQFAKRLRQDMSPPEVRLWVRLRSSGKGGLSFRRQHPIGPYVLDFYCAAAKLAIEVDGVDHTTDERQIRDARRNQWLAEQGILTHPIRSWPMRMKSPKVFIGWQKNARSSPEPSPSVTP